jgi:hypothetical protein
MSELTLAEMAAGPLVKEAEKVLAPEAVAVLGDLREFVSGEMDRLRGELPAVVDAGVAHLHALASGIVGRYQSVVDRIDATLKGATAPPAGAGAPSVPVDPTVAPQGAPTQA